MPHPFYWLLTGCAVLQVYRSWGQSSVEAEELCRQSESSFAHLILLLHSMERAERQMALW